MRQGQKRWLPALAGLLLGALLVGCAQRPQEEASAAQAAAEPTTWQEETQPPKTEQPDVICAPAGIAFAPDGTLLFTDLYNKAVWAIPAGGSAAVYAGGETVAGPYGQPLGGYNDAALTNSYFQSPWAIAPFLDGWAVSDPENNAVRLVAQGITQTINGHTSEPLTVSDMGVVFAHPTGLAADAEGNLYISDTHNGAVRRVTPEGEVTTVADGLQDPMGLCWQDGALYIAVTGENRIVCVRDGVQSPVAGSGAEGCADGAADAATFALPQGVVVDADGTVYVSDTGNSAVRRIRDGKVDTLLARDRAGLDLAPVSPSGMAIWGDTLYVCDDFSGRILTISLQ